MRTFQMGLVAATLMLATGLANAAGGEIAVKAGDGRISVMIRQMDQIRWPDGPFELGIAF